VQGKTKKTNKTKTSGRIAPEKASQSKRKKKNFRRKTEKQQGGPAKKNESGLTLLGDKNPKRRKRAKAKDGNKLPKKRHRKKRGANQGVGGAEPQGSDLGQGKISELLENERVYYVATKTGGAKKS